MKKFFMAKRINRERGQSTIELAVALPFLLWLIFYMFNAFYSIHTGHVGQRYAAMSVYSRLDHRAKFVIDGEEPGVDVGTEFMAVQHLDANGQLPTRKILKGPTQISTIIGICREANCR